MEGHVSSLVLISATGHVVAVGIYDTPLSLALSLI